MHVTRVTIADYRNYRTETVSFVPGINVLSGNNAQGKTNLLEAIYLCSVGRSVRTPRDRELIRSGADRAQVKLEVRGRGGSDRVAIVIDKAESKRVSINGMPITRMGELMGVVSAVYFSPDELRIIKDAPSDRRRFMDIALCQISKAYFYLLSRYNKILSQRNKLLKSGRATDDTLDVWDSQLVEAGAKIVRQRHGFAARLSGFAAQNHAVLTDGAEQLTLRYEGFEGEDVATIAAAFDAELKRSRERDKQLGYTTAGPQKDDLRVQIGDVDVRAYGSQGQQRTAALSLKLSELDLHRSETGEYPVLLLDDVLSELDRGRQQKLLRKIREYQTILTCTHIEDALKEQLPDYTEYRVQAGTVRCVGE